MKIYLAVSNAKRYINALAKYDYPNVLVSYFYVRNTEYSIYNRFKNLFIDSGGFTARQQKKDINVVDYGKWLIRYKFPIYANLDMSDTNVTLKNQTILESMGLKPIPVYHVDEWIAKKYDLFHDYIKGRDYIACGGAAGNAHTMSTLFNFLNFVFRSTKNKIKVHGFGMTRRLLQEKYPFYSVDSSSWMAGVEYGASLANVNSKVKNVRFKVKSDELFALSKETKNILEIYSENKETQHMKRLELSIAAYDKLQTYYTQLWDMKGIKWVN